MALPTVVGVGAVASGAGDVTPAYPAGYTPTTNDVALTFYEIDTANSVTPPSGWASVLVVTLSSGTTSRHGAIWRRVQSGDSAPLITDPGNHIVARMIVVSGCVTSGNPWDLATFGTETTSDLSVSILGGSTTVADCLVLASYSTGQDLNAATGGTSGWANSSLANVTERMDNWTTSGTGGGFAMATGEKAAAGTVDATTATMASPLIANFKALMVIALKGASGAAVTGTAAGSIDFTNTALGESGPVGTAVGSLDFTNTAVGTVEVTATAVGSLALADTVTGAVAVSGTAAGSLSLADSVLGVRAVAGSALGELAFTGTASGASGAAVTGTALGELSFTNTALGVREVSATAAGSLSLTNTALGAVEVLGAAAGSLSLVDTLAGLRGVSGVSAGELAFTGTALGVITGQVQGTALGELSLVGTALGEVGRAGTALGELSLAGTASGGLLITSTGTASGWLLFIGQANVLHSANSVSSASSNQGSSAPVTSGRTSVSSVTEN